MPILWDEMDVQPDIEVFAPRAWCDECKRRTVYRYDAFDMRVCAEHDEYETESLEQ